MVIQIQVMSKEGKKTLLDLCENEQQLNQLTVKELRCKIAEKFNTAENFRLIHTNETLEDNERLVSYGIKHMSVIFVVVILPGGF